MRLEKNFMNRKTTQNQASIKINLQIESAGWLRQRGLGTKLRKGIREAAAELPARYQTLLTNAELTILLTTNARQQRLNHDFRGQVKPTNVLSFPAYNPDQLVKIRQPKQKIYIGDIAIAYQYTVKEARLECKLLPHHVIHLAVHGFLHLLGYDHRQSAAALRMERLERKIMRKLDLPDPYAHFPH